MKSSIGFTLVLGLAFGCTANPAPFPISADASARTLLVGEWTGTYTGRESGRSGSIVFKLESGDSAVTAAHGEHAHGDVLMVPAGYNEPFQAAPEPGEAPGRDPRVLTIDFVRATGTHVSGTLSPYRDPSCGCVVSTTFSGEVEGNAIRGTFISVGASGQTQVGEWEVRRKDAQ